MPETSTNIFYNLHTSPLSKTSYSKSAKLEVYSHAEFLMRLKNRCAADTTEPDSPATKDLKQKIYMLNNKTEIFNAVCEAPPKAKVSSTALYFLMLKLAQDFELAAGIFVIAVNSNLANALIYQRFIYLALKQGDFSKARKALYRGHQAKKISKSILNFYILMTGNAGKFSEAKAAFELAYAKRISDEKTFVYFIQAALKADKPDDVKSALTLAIKLKKLERSTCNRLVTAIALAGYLIYLYPVVIQLFEEDWLEASTYKNLIEAAGNLGIFPIAEHVFLDACEKRKLEEITVNIFIGIASKSQQFKSAETAFEAAEEHKCCGDITKSIFIDACVLAGEIDLAEVIFEERYPEFDPRKESQDFHGMNFGETHIACRKIFSLNPAKVDLIVGRGLHSVKKPVVKQAVEFFCKQHNIAYSQPKYNTGILICRPKQKISLRNMRFGYRNSPENSGYYVLEEKSAASPSPSKPNFNQVFRVIYRLQTGRWPSDSGAHIVPN